MVWKRFAMLHPSYKTQVDQLINDKNATETSHQWAMVLLETIDKKRRSGLLTHIAEPMCVLIILEKLSKEAAQIGDSRSSAPSSGPTINDPPYPGPRQPDAPADVNTILVSPGQAMSDIHGPKKDNDGMCNPDFFLAPLKTKLTAFFAPLIGPRVVSDGNDRQRSKSDQASGERHKQVSFNLPAEMPSTAYREGPDIIGGTYPPDGEYRPHPPPVNYTPPWPIGRETGHYASMHSYPVNMAPDYGYWPYPPGDIPLQDDYLTLRRPYPRAYNVHSDPRRRSPPPPPMAYSEYSEPEMNRRIHAQKELLHSLRSQSSPTRRERSHHNRASQSVRQEYEESENRRREASRRERARDYDEIIIRREPSPPERERNYEEIEIIRHPATGSFLDRERRPYRRGSSRSNTFDYDERGDEGREDSNDGISRVRDLTVAIYDRSSSVRRCCRSCRSSCRG